MKNKKLKKGGSKKKLLLLLPLLLLVLGVGYFMFVREDPIAVNQEEQKAAEQADVDAAKQRIDEESQDEPLKDDDQTVNPPVISGSVALSGLTFSQDGGLISASVTVSGAESGNCSFTFTDGDGRAIIKTAKLSSGVCSVSAPEAEFTMIGEYSLMAKFSDKSVSRTVNIK